MKIYLTILMVLVAMPVMAQNGYTPVPPQDDMRYPDTPVVTWDRFCKKLVNHIASNDVEYKANVDVHGRPVLPADLPRGETFNLPSTYRMFITSDQASKLGLNIPGTPLANDMLIGELLIDREGNASFNGEPIQSDHMYAMCGDPDRY